MRTVSWSRVKTWRRCHKQHDYKYNQRLQRKKRSIPMLRGSILGEMLDARAITSMPNMPKKSPLAVLKKYAKEYAKLFLEQREKYGNVPEDVRILFEGYERKYANENLKYLSVEEFIAIDLGKDIRFIGYTDKRVEDKNGLAFLMDHKTHKVIPNDDQRFSDLQNVFYIWAWNENNKTRPVQGFLWDYIRTKPPTVPEQLKNGELTQRANIDTDYWTYLAEIRRLKLDPKPYAETLARLKQQSDRTYIRVSLPNPSKTMIKLITDDLKETANQIHGGRSNSKDRNMTRMCPSDCDFYQLCSAEIRGLDAKFIQKTEYEERDPDEHQEVEEVE
jgi:hypothetical protein